MDAMLTGTSWSARTRRRNLKGLGTLQERPAFGVTLKSRTERWLLCGYGFSAQQSQHFASDVTRISGGREEYESRRDLFWLRRSLHWRVLSMLARLGRGFVRDVQRRPHR